MAEIIWNMKTRYALGANGDAKVVTAAAIADAAEFFDVSGNEDKTLVLYFPHGTYHFYGTPTTSEDAAIRFQTFIPGGLNDDGRIIIRGDGKATKFIIYNNQSHDGTNSTSQYGIIMRNSRRITFEKFHMTTAQQTACQGTVTAKAAGTVDLLIPRGFALPGDLVIDPPNDFGRYLREYTYRFNVDAPRPIGPVESQIAWTSVVDQGNGIWRFSLTNSGLTVPYAIGSVVGVKCKHGKDPLRAVNCSDLTFRDVLLTRKTRIVFVNCPNTTVEKVEVIRERINGIVACMASPEGGPQLQSTVGANVTGTPVPGLNISGCVIRGTGDDCIGLFEQSGSCFGNICVDSFARGIFNFAHSNGLSEVEVRPNNRLLRCKLQMEEP